MIDRFIYKCCDVLDRYSEWVNNIFILTAGCVKSEHDFITAPPGLTSAIYEQLMKIEYDR